jgi:hypothetical protein
MVVYKVFYKSYELRKGGVIGILIERRKDLRGRTRLESGLRWARFSFTDLVKDRQAIFIVPKELEVGSAPQWMMEKGVFIKEELLGMRDLADQRERKREDHRPSSNRRPILREANVGQEWKGAGIRIRQNLFPRNYKGS